MRTLSCFALAIGSAASLAHAGSGGGVSYVFNESSFSAFGFATFGDVDGNGLLDIVSASGNNLVYAFNLGGTPPMFSFAVDPSLLFSQTLRHAVVADADLDGDNDVFYYAQNPSFPSNRDFRVLENDGGSPASFPTRNIEFIPFVGSPQVLAFDVGDINQDGYPDIVANIFDENSSSRDIEVYINDAVSPPSFTRDTPIGLFLSTPNPSVRIIDLNNDGKPDIVGGSLNDPILIYWSVQTEMSTPENPVFETNTLFDINDPTAGDGWEEIDVGDINGDGLPDIVAAAEDAQLAWFRQLPGPTIDFERVYISQNNSPISQPIRPHLADVDNDGDTDIVVTSLMFNGTNFDRRNYWLENDGAAPVPSFTMRLITDDGETIYDVGDLENDGDIDLAAGGFDYFEQTLVFNETTEQSFPNLSAAITSATNGDSILADPGAFNVDLVDLQGKSLTLTSTGALNMFQTAQWLLADGATVQTQPGQIASLRGLIAIPAGAAATINTPNAAVTRAPLMMPGSSLEFSGSLGINAAFLFDKESIDTIDTILRGPMLASADFNDDGLPDVIRTIADPSPNSRMGIAIYLSDAMNPGSFTIGEVTQADIPTFEEGQELRIGDINGDGLPDIVENFLFNFNLRYLLNNPASPGTFLAPQTPPGLPEEVRRRTVVDIDGDGFDGFMLTGFRNGNFIPVITLVINTGGVFSIEEFTLPESAASIPIGGADFDNDGDIDTLISDGWFETIDLSTGQFSALRPYLKPDGSPFGSIDPRILADMNGDEIVDIVASGGTVILNTGGPDPRLSVVSATGTVGVDPVPIDIDRDGDIDIVSVDSGICIVAAVNDGQLQPSFSAVELLQDPRTVDAAYADFNGDGLIDIVTTAPEFSTLLDGFVNLHTNLDRDAVILSGSPAPSLSASTSIDISAGDVAIGPGTVLSAPTIELFDPGSRRRDSITLSGGGTILGDLYNAATLDIALGESFTIAGNYMQSEQAGTTPGQMRFTTDGTSFGAVSISGSAHFDGALFAPSVTQLDAPVGTAFPLISAADSGGTQFDVAFLPGVTPDAEGNGRFLRIDYPMGDAANGTVTVDLFVDTLTGQIDTDNPEAFGVNGQPVAAAVGDLNEDQLIDLAVALPDPGNNGMVVVLFNAGSTGGVWNGFSSSAQITVGLDPSAVAIGDADRSGGNDIAVTNRGDDEAMIITNDGLAMPSSLTIAQTIPVGDAPTSVAFGDLDEDKWDDIAVANFGSDNITILQNQQGIGAGWNGMGGAQTLPAGDGPIDVIFGDLDEDKWDDVVVLNANDGTVTYFDNTFPPGTIDPPMVLGADAGPLDLGVADLDGDGVNDIFTANPGADSVSIILNNGDSTFEPVVNLPLAGAPRSIAAVDLDDDLDRDLAIIAGDGSGTNTIRVLRNDLTDGQLIFSPDADIDAGGEPLFVLAGDVNNDGQGDLITVNSTSGARSAESGVPAMPIGVVRQSAAPCLGDCDGNGVVEFNDLVSMLFEFGNETAPVECDSDASGVVEFNDLVTALFAFGPCP